MAVATASKLQGGIFTLMVVRIGDPYDPAFARDLESQVSRSPGFFADAPVVLDLRDCLGCTSAEDFVALKQMLRQHGLMAVGVQNASTLQLRAALAADLPGLTGGRPVFPRRVESEAAPAAERAAPPSRTRLVTQPVRSGSQIYARGSDLIVAAPVSAGAELIADGNIHVYGALRGRALAGAAGDQSVRIFAQCFEPELVSIAGRYVVSEAMAPDHLGRAAQVALIDERLAILPGWSRG